MTLIDKDKTVDAISMYLFVNDAVRDDVKAADYRVFARSMICDVPEVDIPKGRYVDADAVEKAIRKRVYAIEVDDILAEISNAPSIDIVRCKECRKSHIDGKTTHYLWCTEWGRSTDTFGYCERGEREGE